MTISAITAGSFLDLGADHYKSAASEGWGNLLDRPAPAGQAAAYQHNQTDLECLHAEPRVADKAAGSPCGGEGPDYDAARSHGGPFKPWSEIMISSVSSGLLHAQHSDFFRPNPNGDGTTVHGIEQGFMDYTDDSCMGLAAQRNHHRVSDGTSNTLQLSEG